MRLLTLIRHAKASRDYPELSDFERPLNDRGRRDAPAMAMRIKHGLGKPDRIVSSPALRAISTARLFATTLGINEDDIVIRPRIYEASADTLLRLVRHLDDDDRHIMLFGHNPGLSEFAHLLARCSFDDMSTCAVAHFSIAAKTWQDVGPGCGKLLRYASPKDHA